MLNINKVNALRLGLSLFLFVILMGVFFFRFLPANYKVAVETVAENNYLKKEMPPYHFYKIITGSSDDYLVVDIRDEDTFVKGHFDNSKNIPLDNLLTKKHQRILKKQDNLIISDCEQLSHAVALLLNQLGIKAVAVNGSYNFITKHLFENAHHKYFFYSQEKKAYDYHRFLPFRKEKGKEVDVKEAEITIGGGC